MDVSGERGQSQAAFVCRCAGGGSRVDGSCHHCRGGWCLLCASRKKVAEREEASERARVGSDDDVPAFESAPASWRSFLRQRSVPERTGPTRSASGTVVTTGGPYTCVIFQTAGLGADRALLSVMTILL